MLDNTGTCLWCWVTTQQQRLWHGHCCATAGFLSCSNCSRHACQAHPSSANAELARSISSQHALSLFLLTGSIPLTLFTSTMHVALFMQACPKERAWPYSHAVVSVSPLCKPLSASLQRLFSLPFFPFKCFGSESPAFKAKHFLALRLNCAAVSSGWCSYCLSPSPQAPPWRASERKKCIIQAGNFTFFL